MRRMYSVRDNLTMEFSNITLFKSDLDALRSYSKAVSDNSASGIPSFADTKELFCVGEFCDDGSIIPCFDLICRLDLCSERFKSLYSVYSGD